MKAGLAQKLFLTTLSTAVMVRMGLTYGNLMTRARVANEKIGQRQVRLVAMATDLESGPAEKLLSVVDGRVELAILCQKLGIDLEESIEAPATSGTLRQALHDNQ
jgi:N-acetylmuramic acid 6-phosphate etherase